MGIAKLMQNPRQGRLSLDALDIEVYMANWESREWLAYHTREPQKPHLYFLWN